MLSIETDGTVTHNGFRIGEVKLDDERHRFKVGGVLRDAPEDKVDDLLDAVDGWMASSKEYEYEASSAKADLEEVRTIAESSDRDSKKVDRILEIATA
mgnify:CR=1 FL=1